jgi:hypothetical protein
MKKNIDILSENIAGNQIPDIIPTIPSLEELLDRITPENVHPETCTGVAVGKEREIFD